MRCRSSSAPEAHGADDSREAGSPLYLLLIAALVAVLVVAAGCSAPINPSFPITRQDASRDLDRMRASPQPIERPLVVLGGFLDPGLASGGVIRAVRPALDGGPIIRVTFATSRHFAECRERVLAAVLEVLPERTEVEPGRYETIEVDVIANSMGGLVARYAAIWPDAPDAIDSTHADTRVRIARLFTISSPHRGAARANPRSISALERDMVTGSAFLAALDEALAEADYELVCYVRLGDVIVGRHNAAPAGTIPHWVAEPPLEAAHLFASYDRRILADIARRLRGEEPLTTAPAAPFPECGAPFDAVASPEDD